MPQTNRYLDELIDYGGILCTRAEAIADMQRFAPSQACIDRWLQGNDHARRLCRRAAAIRISVPSKPKLLVSPSSKQPHAL